jgi:F-type H+-transporting ATPase subunit b
MDIFSSLGIDWNSVLIYLINFGILFLVVMYFATDPILKMLDRRRKFISSTIYESEELKKELVKIKESHAKEKERMQTELAEEMERLKKEMSERKKKMMAQIEEKKQKMLEEARKVVDAEKEKLMHAVEEDIIALVHKIVMRVTSQKISKEDLSKSIAEAWSHYK